MTPRISVIIPTYNPHAGRLEQTISALKTQTLNVSCWELIIVDNNSAKPVIVDTDWHSHTFIISERNQGLTYARTAGINAAQGDIIVMVDDDNILAADYLHNVEAIFNEMPTLGAIGGRSLPVFEGNPPRWLTEFYGNLALRDLGSQQIIAKWEQKYPDCAPIGAGMAVKKEALSNYIKYITQGNQVITDRSGTSLGSGGDNEMVIEVLKAGWDVGYFPQLVLHHIIPQERMQPAYLSKLLRQTNRSWVQLLQKHSISPWKKISSRSVLLRQLRAFFKYRAWRKINYIRWQGACGMFEGLASRQ